MSLDNDDPAIGAAKIAHPEVTYSRVDADWIARLVATDYDVGRPTDCRLMFAGFNDTYQVTVDGQQYAFRLHTRGKWWLNGESDVRFELDLLDHLHEHRVPVSYPLPRRNGDVLGTVHAPEGERFYSLFTWAPGGPPVDMTVSQAYILGRTLATIHVAADLHQPTHTRYRLDEATKLDLPLAELDQQLSDASAADAETIAHYAAEIRTQLARFDPGPTGWGIIHGDIQDLNFHFDADDNITVFDFDMCGYGWRGYDFAYYYTRSAEPQRSAVLDGYQSVRPLTDAEHAMITTFGRLAWIAHDGGPVPRLAKLLRNPYHSDWP